MICGSGNKNGFTRSICDSAAEGMRSSGAEVSILYPSEMDIFHCSGCNDCRTIRRCIHRDDMDIVFSKMSESDLLIIATPIMFSGPTSLTTLVIDRFQPFWHADLPHPAYFAQILCGGSPNPNFKNTTSILKSFSITLGMEWAGELLVPDTDDHEKADFSEEARSFGSGLVSWIKEHR